MCPNIFIFFAPQLCRPTTAMSAERCDRTPPAPSTQKPDVRNRFWWHFYGFPALLTADYRVYYVTLVHCSLDCSVDASPMLPLVFKLALYFLLLPPLLPSPHVTRSHSYPLSNRLKSPLTHA